jgi:hypothetical protein
MKANCMLVTQLAAIDCTLSKGLHYVVTREGIT